MHSHGSLDFGYPWWLSYGHLAVLGVALVLLGVCYRLRWSRRWMIGFGVVGLWALAAAGVMKFTLDAESRAELPTQSFLKSGKGRVVDLGAGTGRSTIMVLDARPQAEVVAVDLFGASYDQHFGAGQSPEERLMANVRAAGHEKRVTAQKADIVQLPFEEASFDAAVSAYVIDHLSRDGRQRALAEAARVLKPGGEFLFIVVANDRWTKFAFGPLLVHSTRGAAAWAGSIREAGFTIVEEANPPGMLYILARRP